MDSEKKANRESENAEEGRQNLTLPLNAAIIAALFKADIEEKRLARRVIWLQTAFVLLAAFVAMYFWKHSQQSAIALLSGGGVSVGNGMLLTWRMSRAALYADHDAQQQLRLLYFYTAERFLAVVVSLAICLTIFKLSPLEVLGGFILGQSVLLIARLFLKIKTETSD